MELAAPCARRDFRATDLFIIPFSSRCKVFFDEMTTFLLTMRSNSGITMTYADLGNVPLFGLYSLGLCMVGVHQGRPQSHAVIRTN